MKNDKKRICIECGNVAYIPSGENGRSKNFMKESLREIMGDDFRQEFPWEDVKDDGDGK